MQDPATILRQRWGWVLGVGVVMVLLGTAAIALPRLMTLGIMVLLGWLLIIGGGFQIASSVRMRGTPGWALALLTGSVKLGLGLIFLLRPHAGAASLTLFLGLWILLDGVLRLVLAARRRAAASPTWGVFAGMAGILLGVLVLAQWPGSGAFVIGLIVGISLLFDGWAAVMLGMALRRAPPPSP